MTKDELISKVENGEEKFLKNAMFNICVNSLAQGQEPIKIINELIILNDNLQKEFERYVLIYGSLQPKNK